MKTATANRPLTGWRILVTRAGPQAKALSGPLRQKGAAVVEIPTIEIHPPASYAALDRALRQISSYDVLILTSVNGVSALFERCRALALQTDFKHLLAVAIGPATARAMHSEGLSVSIVPKRYIAESVAEALQGKISGKSRVLLVRAKIARDVLPSELRRMGAKVDVIEAYETRVPVDAAEQLKDIFSSPATQPRVVTFTSSSTAANFFNLLGNEAGDTLRKVCLASIGPVTSATLRNAGFPPTVEAREYTMNGLVQAISEFAAANP